MCLSFFGFRLEPPASVALVAIPEPLVVTLFQRGQFDAHGAAETARALAWQGAAIFTVAAVLEGRRLAVGEGSSRQRAEEQAAGAAIELLAAGSDDPALEGADDSARIS